MTSVLRRRKLSFYIQFETLMHWQHIWHFQPLKGNSQVRCLKDHLLQQFRPVDFVSNVRVKVTFDLNINQSLRDFNLEPQTQASKRNCRPELVDQLQDRLIGRINVKSSAKIAASLLTGISECISASNTK